MTRDKNGQEELTALLRDALQTCLQLQSYSIENIDAFTSDDDERILEIINKREMIIETLSGIDCDFDAICEEMKLSEKGVALPPEAKDIQRAVRGVLADITTKDMEIMALLSDRMKLYRDETLIARSKQNLSAYMRAAAYVHEPGDSIDLSR